MIAGAAVALAGISAAPPAFADAVSDAKAAVAKYAGPQTTWEGPAKGPKPDPGKKIVFLSGDEQNDISHLYGVYIKEAGEKLGWNVTVIDGKGSPTSWLAGMNQAIALKPDGIALFADASRITLEPSLPWQGRLEIAQGIGLRYLTPFGPIRFDVAYLLNPQTVVAAGSPGTGTKDTPIGPDCVESTGQCIYQRRWAYHITLGEAF